MIRMIFQGHDPLRIKVVRPQHACGMAFSSWDCNVDKSCLDGALEMQELHTPSLLPPVARTSMYFQDTALLPLVSV